MRALRARQQASASFLAHESTRDARERGGKPGVLGPRRV